MGYDCGTVFSAKEIRTFSTVLWLLLLLLFFLGGESCCCRCSLWEAGGWYIKTGCLTKRFEYFLISIVRILTSNVSYVNYRFDARGAERGVDPYAVSLEAFKG